MKFYLSIIMSVIAAGAIALQKHGHYFSKGEEVPAASPAEASLATKAEPTARPLPANPAHAEALQRAAMLRAWALDAAQKLDQPERTAKKGEPINNNQ